MRGVFTSFLRRLTKDRRYEIKNFIQRALKPKSELTLILGAILYELSEYNVRKKQEEIFSKFIQVKNLENDLKEKGISPI
ncbi:hypothetical protein SteCoe_5847 [Stentor coeruleus]|uniref:Uncharacterized protein n=1 Tax=Stentor coeruleus TaxID=5963 RepID=A0A1R2CRG3_9CILI|nr:hypothetical protein SteCoe_5847 [Stentor coeruleus]